LEKLRLPVRGRILLDTLSFEADRKDKAEVNFSKGFSCTKVNLGLFLRREKKGGLRERQGKTERK